jgi:uncharacterized membrane protein
MRVIADTEIAAPRRTVWKHLVDPDRYRTFMDGMTKFETQGTRRNGLGARFSTRMRIGSAELGGCIEIVEYDPPADMAWTSVTGIEQRGRWRLRAADDGRTRVELRVTYHAPGGLMALIADRLAAPIVKRHFDRSLAALKQQIETGGRGAAGPAASDGRPRRRPTRRSSTHHGRRA